MTANLRWEIRIVTSKPQESSWQRLIYSVSLFFEDIKVWSPAEFAEKRCGDFIFTDDRDSFVTAQEHGLRALYLPAPNLRVDLAELFKCMAFSFLTEDAYAKLENREVS